MALQWTRRRLLGTGATALTLGLGGCLGNTTESAPEFHGPLQVTEAHQYSAPGCSCCHEYAAYLRDYLDTQLTETAADDIAAIKREHGVPTELQSCHTLVLDGYVVEGHVPMEVIAKLFEEQPAIDGIALPGMPSGSPGMGGQKTAPFTVYALGGGRMGDVYVEM